MKNPFEADRSAQDRDNPVVPNVLERPAERAADQAAVHDNPLEGQWAKGDNVSTEELRIALTRYRSFFHRLLSM